MNKFSDANIPEGGRSILEAMEAIIVTHLGETEQRLSSQFLDTFGKIHDDLTRVSERSPSLMSKLLAISSSKSNLARAYEGSALDGETKQLKDKITELRSERTERLKEIREMEHRNGELRKEVAHERERTQEIEQTCRIHGVEAESAKKVRDEALDRVGNLEKQLQDQQRRNQALRGMIIKGVKEPIDDNTVRNRFVKIREDIQKIVHRFYDTDPRTQPDQNYMSEGSFPFFMAWNQNLSATDLSHRVRARIFSVLHSELLGRPIFGLEEWGNTGIVGDLEHSLGQFEDALWLYHEACAPEIIEWRIRTINLASHLKLENTSPATVAKVIYKDLLPITLDSAKSTFGDEIHTNLQEKLLRLCRDSFDLAMTLRTCKDIYSCEVPTVGKKMLTLDMEVMDRESRSPTNPIIAQALVRVVMFGGLVKYVQGDPTNHLVLEKAHVVV